jgi:Contractile injection system tube protein
MGFMDTVSSIASSTLKGVTGDSTKTGEVLKMQITAFQDTTLNKKAEITPAIKETKFHIELPLLSSDTGISQKYKIKWTTGGESGGTAQGESAPVQTFGGYIWDTDGLEVKVIVDATGVFLHKWSEANGLIDYKSPNIEKYIERLRKVTYSYNKEAHQPNFLKVTWGTAIANSTTDLTATSGVYRCVLEELTVDYELFSQTGTPVRAAVTLKLKPHLAPEERPLGASPDLSHIIEIKYGDNLPKLCQDIYDSPEYYHQVAKVNGLQSAYDLEPGMRLLFPPLDKFDR